MRYILGLALIVGGALMTIYFEKVYETFGAVDWGEKFFGTGGSRTYYQLLGVIIAIIGMIILFNFHGAILFGLFGSLFPNR